MGIKTPEKFDPFTDRTARDIRNTLSEAFAAALVEMDPAEYLNAARKWRSQKPSAPYIQYIDKRLQRYDLVFKTIREDWIDDPLRQAAVIWNHGLFFEVHDHLEAIWHSASGDERQALKGLIKAAGVYVHLEQQHEQAAKSLAMKSYNLLRQYPHCLSFIANYETLLDKLKKCDRLPPQLEIASLHD
ncbi:MAG: DUF309 domain-containing protein [Desulfobacterales bacterium]|jgi:hypothetical protein